MECNYPKEMCIFIMTNGLIFFIFLKIVLEKLFYKEHFSFQEIVDEYKWNNYNFKCPQINNISTYKHLQST